jgi:hypothetical protein
MYQQTTIPDVPPFAGCLRALAVKFREMIRIWGHGKPLTPMRAKSERLPYRRWLPGRSVSGVVDLSPCKQVSR